MRRTKSRSRPASSATRRSAATRGRRKTSGLKAASSPSTWTGSPPTITIANRDGNVVVVLSGDALAAARYIKVGDYVTAEGEKQHELLFWASDLSKD